MAARIPDLKRLSRRRQQPPIPRRTPSSALAPVAPVDPVALVAAVLAALLLIPPLLLAQETDSSAEASRDLAVPGEPGPLPQEQPTRPSRPSGSAAATLLLCFHLAWFEASKTLEVNRFLESEDLPGTVRSSSALRDLAAPIVQICLDRGDFETGDRVFRHAVALAERKKARGDFGSTFYTSWTFPSSLLRMIAHDHPGGGLERIAFHQFVARRDEGATVKPSHSTPLFGDRLHAAFESAGGLAAPAEALDSVASQLHEICREAYPELLGIYFMELIRKLPPAFVGEAIAWADERAQAPDLDWAPLAREFAMAGRLVLYKSTIPARQAVMDEVPDPASCQEHYLAVLRDETLPYPVRITIARGICSTNPQDLLEPALVLASAEVLADGLAADSPASVWSCFYIAREFNRLADEPEWEPVARRLHAAWVHANRTNDADRRTEAGFWPDTEPSMEMLRLSAQLRDPEALESFLGNHYVKGRIENNARALFLLVENGHHAEAAALLPRGMEWMDISENYRPGERTLVRYTRRVHEQLPAFLQAVENPSYRYFGELLIIGAPDLPPSEAEPDANYPNRGQRLRDAALRLGGVNFVGSQQGLHLRTRCIEQIAAFDGPALAIRSEWEKDYSPEKAVALCTARDTKRAHLGAPSFATFAAMRLRDGDLRGVTDMLHAVNNQSGSVTVRRAALEHFSLRFLRAYGHHWPNAEPDELDLWLEAFDLLIEVPEDRIAKHRNLSRLVATHFAATLLANQQAGHPTWLAALDPRQTKLRTDAVRDQPQEFLDSLAAALKYRSPHPEHGASPQRRAEATLLAFSDPCIQEAFGRMNPSLFARLLRFGHLDREHLLGETGERLAEVHPRGGWAAAELAQLAAEGGDFETAFRWAKRSLAVCGAPAQSPDRYARLVAAKADLLVAADRSTDALRLLDDLAQQIDLDQLPPSAKAAYQTSRRQAGS